MAATIASTSSEIPAWLEAALERDAAWLEADEAEWGEFRNSEAGRRSLEAQAETAAVTELEWDKMSALALDRQAAELRMDLSTDRRGAARGQANRHRRAPGAQAVRKSGSKRSSASAGSSSSDDPDESDQSDLGAERRCGCGCGESIDHRGAKAEYLNDTHAARTRKRAQRHGDLTANELADLADARATGYIPPGAEDLPPAELFYLRGQVACRCNGSHIDGGCVGCFRCGRPYDGAVDR
jgi:hypothetical protein